MSTKYVLAVSWLESILGWRKRQLSYCEYLFYGRGNDTSNSLLEKVKILLSQKVLPLNIVNTQIVALAYYNQKTRESLISLLRMHVLIIKEQKEVKANLFTELL